MTTELVRRSGTDSLVGPLMTISVRWSACPVWMRAAVSRARASAQASVGMLGGFVDRSPDGVFYPFLQF